MEPGTDNETMVDEEKTQNELVRFVSDSSHKA